MTPHPNRRAIITAMAAASSTAWLSACGGASNAIANTATTATSATTATADDLALTFDPAKFTTVNITLNGVATVVRQYRVVYAAKPIKMALSQATLTGAATTIADPFAYQTMIISVPAASVGSASAAIYMLVNNSGWFASPVSTMITEGAIFTSTDNTNNIGAALRAGYIVVNVGSRSRGGARAEDGRWMGKAPAAVVDVKAAIRYLRLNKGLVPGAPERIILTGTSGGGALTAAVAASGNSADYLPYLTEIGAAGITGSGSATISYIKDDVYAAVAYCPINNLGNADTAYEWQYGAVRTDTNTSALNNGGANVAYAAAGSLQVAASAALATAFPAYVNGLGLTREDASALTAANLPDQIMRFLKEEIERQIASGTAVPALGANFTFSQGGPALTLVNDWLTLSGSGTSATVASIDYTKFLRFVAASRTLKSVVAFDAVGVTNNKNADGSWRVSGETNLFGSTALPYSNFTEWTWTNNQVIGDGSGVNDTNQSWSQYLASSSDNLAAQLKLINPIDYINSTANTAPYWYVRHGMIDRDTSFAIQLILHYALKKSPSVKDVNFKLPYLTGHTGNYDVQEAFAWIKAKLEAST